jgi:hypothetical protein
MPIFFVHLIDIRRLDSFGAAVAPGAVTTTRTVYRFDDVHFDRMLQRLYLGLVRYSDGEVETRTRLYESGRQSAGVPNEPGNSVVGPG